jgi:predicted porin
VIFGRHDSPFKDVGRKLDIFGDTIGDTRALTRLQPVSLNVLGVSVADIPVSGGAGLVGWDERLDNLIAYISPDFAGFKLFAAYSTDIQRETQTAVVIPGVLELSPYRSFLPAPDNNDADAWSASLTYETGPFFAAVAYEGHSFIVDQIDPVTGAIISSDEEDEDGWRVGGGVTFGPAKVGAMWQHTSTDFNPFEEDVDNDRDVWNVFGQFAFGATNIGLQWTRADESDLEDDGANLYSLGLFHNLSKRTQVYAMYSYLDNDEDAFFALAGGGGHGDTYFPSFDNDDMEFEDVQAASVGVIHSF